MDGQVEDDPCPKKRIRLARDEFLGENGERQISEIRDFSEQNCSSIDREGFLLVETDNDSINNETLAVLKAYDLHGKKSHVLSTLTAEMITSGLCIVLLCDELYIFIKGGKLFCLKDVERWTEMCPTSDFHDVPAIEMDGYLIVLGSRTEECGKCERYDPAVNEWSEIGSTIRKSDFCCMVALGGWIYAVGYEKTTTIEGSVAKYDPVSNVWKDVASPKLITSPIVATTLNGEIYVAGKDSSNAFVVEVYSPSQNVWRHAVFGTYRYDYLGLFTMSRTLIAIRRKSSSPPCSKGVEIATVDFQCREWISTDKLENSTLDTHPTLYCTMRLVGNYFVLVKTDEERFICCLAKLMEKSPYFRAMFKQNFREKKTRIVDFCGVDPEALKLCIRHITDDYFPDELDVIEKADSLFYAARMLLLDELVAYLSDFYGEKICLENFPVLRSIAYKYDLKLLEEACDDFAVKNFKAMVEQEYFPSFEPNYLEYLLRSIKEEAGINEAYKLKAVLTWISADENARKEHFSDLLTHFDVPKIELATLEDAVKKSLVHGDKKLRRKFRNAIKKRSKYHQVILQRRSLDPRKYSFYAYFWKRSRWMPTKLPPQTSHTVLHCFATSDSLYLIDKEKKLFSLDLTNLSGGWQERAPLILTSKYLAFVTTDTGVFYAFGVGEAAKYDASTDSWSTVEFSETRTQFAAAALKESIYILGGREAQEGESENSGEKLSTVLRYDTVSEKWFHDVAPMSTARHSHTAVSGAREIFVIGGDGSNDGVMEEYIPVLDVWSPIENKFESVFACKPVTMNEEIVLLGRARCASLRVMQVFDLKNYTWKKRRTRPPLEPESSVCVSIPYDLIDE